MGTCRNNHIIAEIISEIIIKANTTFTIILAIWSFFFFQNTLFLICSLLKEHIIIAQILFYKQR
jgi:hypothetical protein